MNLQRFLSFLFAFFLGLAIALSNGCIAGVGDFDIPKVDDICIIDCTNKIITQGFCDLHAHFREPGEDDAKVWFFKN